MLDMSYKKLMKIFENVKLDYNDESNSDLYVEYIFNAINFIKPQYLFIQNHSINFDSEVYRPISYRQSSCLLRCVSFVHKGLYTSAMNELLDAIEDYDNYNVRNILSINEIFLLNDVLEIFYSKLIENKKDEI